MVFISILDLWNIWKIRGFVILSLLLQVFLTLFAPLRKKIANYHIIFLLWLAYLMADWVAAFAIGLISHNQCNSSAHGAEVNGAIQAFWASFLLLHLGGPDTITAFSLEDSLLWQRHMFSLIFQVGAAIYVFANIFPIDKHLVIPTMLVFFTGIIKNAERLLALNLSSLPRIRERVLSQHASSMYGLNLLHASPYHEGGIVGLSESDVVYHAHCFFQIFKVFLGDLMFTMRQREQSRKYFCKAFAMDALRVISVELHFMYEMLHTKALTIHSKWSYIFRFIGFINIVIAFILFNYLKKNRLPQVDVRVTYSLLLGGIALDMISLFMLVLSDWTFARIQHYTTGSPKLESFLNLMLGNMDNQPRITTCEVDNVSYDVLDTPLIFRRWSESISACNLFSESLRKSPRKIYKGNWCWGIFSFCKISSFEFCTAKKIVSFFHQASEKIAKCYESRIIQIANMKYMSKNPFIMKLWIFIFEEVKFKSQNMTHDNARKVFEARGDLYLELRWSNDQNLLKYVTDANYDASIIIWHIATEMWYHREEKLIGPTTDEMEFSKILSDYMLYLLINQPNVMSTVAGVAQITSAETLMDIQLHIYNVLQFLNKDVDMDVKGLCMLLFEVPFISTAQKSLLSEGIQLANLFTTFGGRKWKVISGVWVEMLTYAATHIRGEAHVQVLSKGGELLAFIWLLTAHFGCFYRPPWGMSYNLS